MPQRIELVFGRPLQVTVRPMLRDRCPVCRPCLSVTLVYCGQKVGWIRIPLGAEVGLGPDNIVLDGDPSALRKEAQQPPRFGPCLLWPNGRPSQQLVSCCVRW